MAEIDETPDTLNNLTLPGKSRKGLFIEKALFIIAATGAEFFLMIELTDMKWIASPYWVLAVAVSFAIAGFFYRKHRKNK